MVAHRELRNPVRLSSVSTEVHSQLSVLWSLNEAALGTHFSILENQKLPNLLRKISRIIIVFFFLKSVPFLTSSQKAELTFSFK